MKKHAFLMLFLIAGFMFFSYQAEAKTAVTIAVEAGPALTEGNLQTVDLIVPERPAEAMPLNVGDKVFFESLEEQFLMGEGTITNIYDTENPEINEAIILDHVRHE